MRVGGRAEWLLEPATPDELRAAWIAALERGAPPRVLGGGANLLVGDGELPGVVIATERMVRTFRPEPGGEPDLVGREHVLVAWAGAGLPGLARTARDLGLTGLECLVGVPGQLGGGVAMNAGGRYGELWDVIERVSVLTPDGELVERPRAACSPSYRNGGLGDDIAVAAVLRLEPASPDEVRERMRAYLAEKSAAQPVTEASSGCIFKNPDPELSDGRSAGKLVEDCGGKGLSRGDAIVSRKHGNFIVNRGGATAADVLGLIEDLKRLVADRTGIVLEREVRVWEAATA